MVQEIKQVLMDREETCHRTCFTLQLDGNTLDNFTNLKSIPDLQDDSLLKIVEGKAITKTLTISKISCNISQANSFYGFNGFMVTFVLYETSL